KRTQAKLLVDYLNSHGKRAEYISFPRYEKNLFGQIVGEYLDKQYGDFTQVSPLFAALLYACDRFQSRDELTRWLGEGKIIVANRYIGSNLAHQSARIIDIEERNKFIQRIEKIEYDIFGLPREDLVLYMNINPHVSQELVLKKPKRAYTDKKKDLHEENPLYLSDVAYRYQWLAQNRKNWRTIQCLDEQGNIRSAEEISKVVRAEVKKVI
ncbi:MAG: thymidylate kinase, partial [Parcubacteria group bacterium GW2011_GWA2_47_8]